MNKKATKLFLLLFALLLPTIGWAQDQTYKQNGLIFTFDTDHYELTGYDAAEFGGYIFIPYDIESNNRWYPVTKLKAGALDGITNVTSVSCYAELREIPEGFFKGIGSQEKPVDGFFDWYYLSEYGATFNNGVCQVAGGFFIVYMNYWSNGCSAKYWLINDKEYQFIDLDIEDNDNIEFRIVTQYSECKLTKVLPEVTAKLAKVASKVKKVIIEGDNIPEIDANAFAGIGTTTAPVDLETTMEIFSAWGGNTSTGQLLGGYFALTRSMWAGSGFPEISYRLTSNGYVLSDPIQYYEGRSKYSLRIYVQIDDNYLTEIKADAFKNIRQNISNMNLTELKFDGDVGDGSFTIEDGTFEGFGTDDNPVNLNITPSLLKKIGKITPKGNYEIADGYFTVGVTRTTDDYVLTYVLNENDSYTLARVVENEGSQNNQKMLVIESSFWNNNVRLPVTAIADNACEGIGSAEAPVRLSMYKTFAKNLGAKTENGVTTLAGGFFELGYVYDESYTEGTTVFYKLEDDGQSYTVKGYTQDLSDWFKNEHPEGYQLTIYGTIGDNDGTNYFDGAPVTKIAPDAFKDIKDVYAVKLNNSSLTEVAENAFSGIGTAEKPASLSINLQMLKKLNPPSENGVTRLGGGYFEIASIQETNGVNVTYSYVDGHYELSSVTPRYSNEEYTIYVYSELDDYWDEETQKWVYPPVTKIRANAFANMADKITAINIQGSAIEIEDGAFKGIGTLNKPASITASNTIIKAALGEKLAEGIYNIKGGVFALNAITIKAQKNPEGLGYSITYAYIDGAEVFSYDGEEDEEGNWRPKAGTYDLMEAPAQGSDYYTYTFLSANQIMGLRLTTVDENNWPMNDVYSNKAELEITKDTIFVWREDINKLWLKDAPEEYDFWLAERYVTSANADDILADDKTNAGKAKYDPKTNTLTLDGVDIQISGTVLRNENNGLTIVLKGQNKFRTYSSYGWVRFDNAADLTITGGGVLDYCAYYKENGNDGDAQIYSNYGNLTFKNVTLNMKNACCGLNVSNRTLTIDAAVINIDNTTEYALRAKELVLGDGTKIVEPEGGSMNDRYLCDAEGNRAKKASIVGFMAGDANGDGTINAADIVEVVNYIMGSPSNKFKMGGADANGDFTVNAADIVAIVNTIMGN